MRPTLLAVLAIAIVASAAQGAEKRVSCGTRPFYGHTLKVIVTGKQIPCADARKIAAGACKLEEKAEWGCWAPWPDKRAPQLAYFKLDEQFDESPSTMIELPRYPCAEARVTRALWSKARPGDMAFPNRRQVIADDVVRCHLLRGRTRRATRALLGRPSERSARSDSYVLGAERDSFFQVDSEYLVVRFDRRGRVTRAELAQG